MERQPTLNIATLGHVANGKSSLVRALTRKRTQRFKAEILTDKTIMLGYANCKIYKCECESPQCYSPEPDSCNATFCDVCKTWMTLAKHVSFVDCPGHSNLMKTVLSGTCVMDSAILVASASNPTTPAPQTMEHILVTRLMELESPIVVLNKIDLVSKKIARAKIEELSNAIKGTGFSNAPVIPMSANLRVGVEYVCEHIVKHINPPDRDTECQCEMTIIRSFNVNRQNAPMSSLKGGVVGGSVTRGSLTTGDPVTVLPGTVTSTGEQGGGSRFSYVPIVSEVVSMKTDSTSLTCVVPGGLVAVELKIDPFYAVRDKLVGSLLLSGDVAETDVLVMETLTISYHATGEAAELNENRMVILSCNAKSEVCRIKRRKGGTLTLEVRDCPMVVRIGSKVALCDTGRSKGLLGYGEVLRGRSSVSGAAG